MALLPQTPQSAGPHNNPSGLQLPDIDDAEPLVEVLRQLSEYLVDAIDAPHTFEQLRTASVGHILRPLIQYLTDQCHHPDIISALLILKWQFAAGERDDRGVHETRGYACEIVAWRFLAHLTDDELIEYLLHELPSVTSGSSGQEVDRDEDNSRGNASSRNADDGNEAERAGLLWGRGPMIDTPNVVVKPTATSSAEEEPLSSFVGLNALEIAAVANAKQFLSQNVVQKIVDDIWNGRIIFWESLSVHSKKKAKIYDKRRADPYCRLRVPKYQKGFEALFFALFLVLYYAVLVERKPEQFGFVEGLLYVWIVAFGYDEFGEFQDAGSSFYATDFWSLWDLGIIGIGFAYMISRVIGLVDNNAHTTDVALDILSLEAIFLLPRVCSLLSLIPFFGTLIPCLKEMTKDFVKFLGIVVILFCAFLTTFTMLARGEFTANEMLWIMINVFFGSAYLGFDIATQISRALGPALMLCFVVLSNILLLTSLIAILSQVFTKVMDHAREEYLYQYSVFVLEASASRRLTYYFPPLNLIPLLFFRPLRVCLPSKQIRSARIILLKVTHFPYIVGIWVYEELNGLMNRWQKASISQKRLDYAGNYQAAPRSLRRPNLRSRSEASIPKTPVSGGRTSLGLHEADMAAILRRIDERMATLERKVDQLST